jgi:GTP pyrophosphokinase
MKYDIMGRSKQLYSIYKKMTVQHKQLDEIFDLVAVRVIVETVRDCYAVLGQVHTMWKPIPGRFKDYIAMPKPNMYQSLHTTVLGDNGVPFEIQIRTYEMHRVAEYGIAAHWKYKEGNTSGNQNKEEMKLAWLRQAIEWQKDLQDPKDFLDTLKMDLFSSQVFVFTPKGEVIDLPAGSTPLDFAFKIHTDVGCHCVGAKVNGKMVTIDHPLSSGDIVEIVTNPNSSGPSVDWLKIVKSSTAKNKIRSWLKKQTNGDDVNRGREALDKYIRKKGYEPSAVTKTQFLNLAMKKMNFVTLDEAYKQLAQGGSLVSRFAKILFEQYDQDQQREQEKKRAKEEALLKAAAKSDVRKKKKRKDAGIIVKGMDGLMVRVAHCCNPVPGDDIVGFITKGRGVSVHRKDCTNITSMPESERARFIEVEWKKDEPEDQMYQAGITVIFNDRKGMFSDVSRVCDEMDVNIERVNGRVDKDGRMRLMLSLSIRDINQVEKIMGKMRKIPDVISTYRSGV